MSPFGYENDYGEGHFGQWIFCTLFGNDNDTVGNRKFNTLEKHPSSKSHVKKINNK